MFLLESKHKLRTIAEVLDENVLYGVRMVVIKKREECKERWGTSRVHACTKAIFGTVFSERVRD